MISNHLVPSSGPALATSELHELLTERGMDRRRISAFTGKRERNSYICRMCKALKSNLRRTT